MSFVERRVYFCFRTALVFICRVTYFHSFDTYILKMHREIRKLQAVKLHMHHGYATTNENLPTKL